MRTTLDLPEDLLSETMRLTHTEKTTVILKALEELIGKTMISDIKNTKAG